MNKNITKKRHPVSVVIIDDNVSFCIILSEAINRSGTLSCPKYFHTVKEAIAGAESIEPPPEVILLDIKMPSMNGVDGLIPLGKHFPKTKIVMLTSYDNESDIKMSLQRGAMGYLSKTSNHNDIIRSIERLADGGKVIDPSIAERMIEELIPKRPMRDYHLTMREKEVIKKLISGKSNGQIATELMISAHTVEAHRRHAFEKLNVHTTTHLVAKALKEGII